VSSIFKSSPNSGIYNGGFAEVMGLLYNKGRKKKGNTAWILTPV